MTQSSGRITCPRCGANNFETVTSCWKCSTPLAAGAGGRGAITLASELNSESPRHIPDARASTGDPDLANRAALYLALVIPFIGLPVGWVFMMIEDRRLQRVGKTCVIWSLAGLIFHILLFGAFSNMVVHQIGPLLKIMSGAAGGSSAGGSESGLPQMP